MVDMSQSFLLDHAIELPWLCRDTYRGAVAAPRQIGTDTDCYLGTLLSSLEACS